MYVATRKFRYRDTQYNPGDTVPAERWPSRKAFLLKRMIKVSTAESQPSASAAAPLELPDLKKMKRGELNVYAESLGIENPDDTEKYPNREKLIEKIEETAPKPPVGPVTPSDLEKLKESDSEPSAETDESPAEGGESPAEGDENPFADLEEEEVEGTEEETEGDDGEEE